MYMETTHGYYDVPLLIFGQNKSILPMNINVDYWGDAFGTHEELEMPVKNLSTGQNLQGPPKFIGFFGKVQRDVA
jgi:hypothetical protein